MEAVHSNAPRRSGRWSSLHRFLHDEAAGGVVLVVGALVAVAWANSGWSSAYTALWDRQVTLGVGPLALTENLQHWVNDGLMVLFFFVVGLEIKREIVVGELRRLRAAALPAVGAVGGVVLPAGIFLVIAGGAAREGWAIPVATDIAFAVGVIALLGSRVPAGAKLLLLSVAIVDDIIAITVIAVAYTDAVSLAWLLAAVGGLGLVLVLNRVGVTAIWPYVILGVVVWYATHESGVHATIAGVALGLLTPTGEVGGRPVLERLEHRLHPVSAFVVVPLFALANAGVDLRGGVLAEAAASTLTVAIVAGLVVGKVVGISLAVALYARVTRTPLPDGVRWGHVVGVAGVAGIGFTVSLFIAELAYDDPALVDTAKVGIFAGSILAGLVGATLLVVQARRQDAPRRAPSAAGTTAGPG